MNQLGFNDTVTLKGKFNGKTTQEIIDNNRGDIFELIKAGVEFTDDVLSAAHIKKTIRDRYCGWVFDKHVDRSNRVYKKDTATIKEVLKSIENADNYRYFDEEFEEDDCTNEEIENKDEE